MAVEGVEKTQKTAQRQQGSKRVMPCKRERSDEAVMGTNNSSIVSKRSVERIYYDKPHFFQHFVKKPQRRSPLINRGYWLRMRAVDLVVERFLDHAPGQKKIVLNLGCGYDPLAFQWLSKSGVRASDTTFIDIDFPALIDKKRKVVSESEDLSRLIGPIEVPENPNGIYLKSPHYLALGCDLSDTARLESLLSGVTDLSKCLVLCTAEVSMTYMPSEAADNLISWIAKLPNVRFGLLEQYLPDGPDHPFASKMLKHFNNLQTPLKSIEKYPGLADLRRRFQGRGWSSVQVQSLWDIYCRPDCVSLETKRFLETREPFDEWEEFILFASHYFLLEASNGELAMAKTATLSSSHSKLSTRDISYGGTISSATEHINDLDKRRFGAVASGKDRFGYHGGLALQRRTGTTTYYQAIVCASNDRNSAASQSAPGFKAPEARMCHSITRVSSGNLLVGGRNSPNEPLKDCWLLSDDDSWQRVDDIPCPLFRHCATNVQIERAGSLRDCVLVYGGKTSASETSDKWFMWHADHGWQELRAHDKGLIGRFGAAMIAITSTSGILMGGMSQDGSILRDAYEWRLLEGEAGLTVEFQSLSIGSELDAVLDFSCRFGAVLQPSSSGLMLIGGVADQIIPETLEILVVKVRCGAGTPELTISPSSNRMISPRPLLVGHSTVLLGPDVFIIGGGAVCFSFGTFWNQQPLVLSQDEQSPGRLIMETPKVAEATVKGSTSQPEDGDGSRQSTFVTKQSVTSSKGFEQIVNSGQPAVLCGLDIGSCVTDWQDLESVKHKVGAEREVIVHQSQSTQMNFQCKNFSYEKKLFGAFLDEITDGSMQYLRSIASTDPTSQAANLEADFPTLSADFSIPEYLQMVQDRFHSSVLRVSGPVNMWLHYDVMANILCQVRGTKTLLLYPPSDVSSLSFPAGSSTSTVDCFSNDTDQRRARAQTNPHKVQLEPGQVLFIPPLWSHAAAPGPEVSISVNVFFRNLTGGYAPGRDVYGNRDLQVYEQGRREVARICQSFDRLPADMRGFYLTRLGDELKTQAWTTP